MKFTGIEVENIFAYGAVSRIDLSGATPERNIVLVRGRNGAGKTSLLNAIKLLFMGSKNDEVRRVGYGGTAINRKAYVLGQPGRWYGVFNTGSRASGAPARVSIDWADGDRKFKAERIFRLSGADFTETFSITVDGAPMGEFESEEALTRLLPPELASFFFFDGEQIQSIADAEIGREQAEIERLLGLAFTVHLNREIEAYSKDRQRAGLPEMVRLAITRADNAQREAEAQLEATGRERVALEGEILDLERTRQRLDQERNRLRTGISDSDRRRMQGRIAVLESQREVLAEEIATAVPAEAIWFTSPQLIRQAYDLLESQVGQVSDATAARKLHDGVPETVFAGLESLEPPVSLTTTQRGAVAQRLRSFLVEEGFDVDHVVDPLLRSISPRVLRELRDRFLIWTEQGSALVGRHIDQLSQLRQITAEHLQAVRDLDEAELTTDEARDRFDKLTTELEQVGRELELRADKVTEFRVAEQKAQREATDRADEIRRLLAKEEETIRQNQAYQFSLRVKRALEDFRERRRTQIKGSVQALLNSRVSLLLGPSQLIKSVELDDQFVMSYFDDRGEPVARHSISAGMRQLLAMSLLWALKDHADRPVPVIIDTPLGRIDKTNRALLLHDYFPMAGNPLVLLPTSSEIAEDELALLAGHVSRRYDIKNDSGDYAEIVLDARYEAGAD